MQSNKIQQPSQELFVEILSTLPLRPVYGYVDFAADGISLPTRWKKMATSAILLNVLNIE